MNGGGLDLIEVGGDWRIKLWRARVVKCVSNIYVERQREGDKDGEV